IVCERGEPSTLSVRSLCEISSSVDRGRVTGSPQSCLSRPAGISIMRGIVTPSRTQVTAVGDRPRTLVVNPAALPPGILPGQPDQSAADWVEALARLREQPFDVVVSPASSAAELDQRLQQVERLAARQRMLEQLHQAGRELAALEPAQLAEMDVATRIELLK